MKQPPHKCLAAWLLALIMVLTMLPVGVLALEEVDDGAPAEAGELSLPDEEVPSISVEITETVAPAVGSQSDAELLEGYLYAISGIQRGSTVYRVPPRPLTVELKDVEDALKGKIKEVAAGELASTKFSFANTWTKTKAEWGIASDDPVISGGKLTSTAEEAIKAKLGLDALMRKQLLEMPYELYWYNKTQGVSMGYSVVASGDNVTVKNLTIRSCDRTDETQPCRSYAEIHRESFKGIRLTVRLKWLQGKRKILETIAVSRIFTGARGGT